MIPFGPYLPDLPALGNPGATVATSVIPYASHYEPWRTLVTFTNALTARCRGAAAGRTPLGLAQTFAGDASKLYSLSDATWSDVSKVGGYTVATEDNWEFCQFGNLIIATDFADAIQAWEMGTSSAFADLESTAPKARHIATVKDFVMAGNVDDATDNEVPNRVAWGPLGDPEGVWTPSVTTQADYQDIPTGGAVQRIVGGETATIFMERAIWRGTYVGGDLIFQFDELEPDRGCAAPGSVAPSGRMIFFLSDDGLYIWDGTQSVPVGADKFNRALMDDIDAAFFYRISAAVDPLRQLYVMAYPGNANTSGTPNKILVYNWQAGRAAIVSAECEIVARLLGAGYTLDTLDNVSMSLDALPASLDSRDYIGGSQIFGGFGTDHKLGRFDGSNLAAVLETGEFQPFAPRRTFVHGVRPLVDGTATVQLGYRDLQSSTVTWSDESSTHAETGVAPFHHDVRFARARVSIAAGVGWTRAQGIDDSPDLLRPAGFR